MLHDHSKIVCREFLSLAPLTGDEQHLSFVPAVMVQIT